MLDSFPAVDVIVSYKIIHIAVYKESPLKGFAE